MTDAGKTSVSKTISKEDGSTTKSKKKSKDTPYFSDSLLLRRVDKYLEEREHQDIIDKEEMVEDLRNEYKEYKRRNKDSFRAAVLRAYDITVQTCATLVTAEDMDTPSDMDISSEESNSSVDYDRSTPQLSNKPETNKNVMVGHVENGKVIPYIQHIQKMINNNNGASGPEELINISSDEDEKEESKKAPQKVLPPKKPELSLAKFLPPGTRATLLTASSRLPKDTVIIRKRKDNTPLSSLIKRPKSDAGFIPKVTFQNFGGNPNVLISVCQLIMHMKHPEVYKKLGVTPPRGFLLHGPPGCGKTLLAHAIAGELKVPLVKAAAPELVAGVSGESEQRIRDLFDQAAFQAPCILFIDEVDAISTRRDLANKDMERRIVAQLLASLDELNVRPEFDQVLVIGATNRPDSLDPAMRRAGRFDREVCLGIPDREGRSAILRVLCSSLRLKPGLSLDLVAASTPGYVGADLKALTSEAAIAAVRRTLEEKANPVTTTTKDLPMEEEKKLEKEVDQTEKETVTKEDNETEKEKDTTMETSNSEEKEPDTEKEESSEKKDQNSPLEVVQEVEISVIKDDCEISIVEESKSELEKAIILLHKGPHLSAKELDELFIEMEDFMSALKTVQPSAKREGFATVPDVTWEDIGSLKDIRSQLEMSIMMPVKYPAEFIKLGVTSPTGIMLCGPPGCGKTLLAKAVANEANINFISVKGPELLNMYVGESERAVRQCFQRARNSQPCVIFFDELDALCPKRSDSIEGSAGSRVVNQLLTEMDGVEGRRGVFMMAATNRPDMVDPAVMRPGRFDKILYVGLPNADDRTDILKAITKNGSKPLLEGVDLTKVASDCKGYSGADLAALVKEASVLALEDYIKGEVKDGNISVKSKHIGQALLKIRPSVSDKDKKRYDAMRLQYAAPGTKKTDSS